MTWLVIMAGGKGTRFWPLSREDRPKQLLAVVEQRTMIQATAARGALLAPPERTLIVTGAAHAVEIARQLPSIPAENIIVEPAGRNTAPCVALAAAIVHKRSPGALMAVLPADHVIADPEKLRDTALELSSVLDSHPDKLGAIGITPAYPETGYGYLRLGKKLAGAVHQIDGFTEKPDITRAHQYVDSGKYLWNSGMFFWKTGAIQSALARYAPELAEGIKPLAAAADTPDFPAAMERVYPTLPSISIDYAVMERAGADGLAVAAAADPGWSDVGSWRTLYDLIHPDPDGNRAKGELVAVNSSGLLAHNPGKLVAAVGVHDLIIVDTEDAILICAKTQAQDVRLVIEELKKREKTGLL